MLRKLTAKAQKIVPTLPSNAKGFSNAFVIEPDNEDLADRKGTLYTIFQVNSSEEFDTSLISKIVSDVLHDSYYQSENISPVQSLEKAIVEVRDRVTKLTNESIRYREAQVTFNILASALWGNVLYVVCYGNATNYLVRDGQIRPVSTNSEGHFSAASGVIKDEDVLVFTTQAFSEKIPPEVLLNTAMSLNELSLESSALILKIEMDSDFTEDEIVDFGNKPEKENDKDKKPLLGFLNGVTSKISSVKPSKTEKETTQQPLINTEKPMQITALKVKRGFGRKEKISSLIAIAGILLAVSIIWSLRSNRHRELAQGGSSGVNENQEVLSSVSNDDVFVEPVSEDTANDELYKIQRVAAEVFYDLQLTDPAAQPSFIELSGSKILVHDKNAGKTYESDLSTAKFTLSAEAYEDLGIAAEYLGNTYILNSDTITKKTSSGEESTWAQQEIINGGRSISIDGAIYILKTDGSLIKFMQGEKEDFAVTGLDKPLSGATQVLTDYDFDHIYVADTGNKRIVVLNKNGALVQQYLNKNMDDWNSIRGVAVNSEEETIYVLSGTKVFTVKTASIDQTTDTP